MAFPGILFPLYPKELFEPMESAFMAKQYPSEWFKENPGEKPGVELPVMDAYNLDQLRSTIKHFLLNDPSRELDQELVLLYFRKLAGTMRARLSEDWKSFGITIGKAGSAITPLDIVDVVSYRCAIELDLESTVTATPEDDLVILMALVAVFYNSVASAVPTGTAIRASPEIFEMWKNAGLQMSQLGQFWRNNWGLVETSSFRIMVAVFDMFFVKFPDHKLCPARSLTSASRFFRCAGYQSFARLSEITKKEFGEIEKWLWTSQLQKDYAKITYPGQEIDQPYSYAPYFIVLHLSSISPYSPYANANLFVFSNIVRATLKDRYARWAQIPDKTIVPNVPINAFVFAYMLAYGEERLDGLPEGNDFEGWSKWFSKNHSTGLHAYYDIQPPRALIQKLSPIWSAFEDDPPESIGNMLYKLTLDNA